MFSPSQYQDKKFLLELAELIELLVRIGTTQSLDLAEKFGEDYIELENKIKTHDYKNEDKIFYWNK